MIRGNGDQKCLRCTYTVLIEDGFVYTYDKTDGSVYKEVATLYLVKDNNVRAKSYVNAVTDVKGRSASHLPPNPGKPSSRGHYTKFWLEYDDEDLAATIMRHIVDDLAAGCDEIIKHAQEKKELYLNSVKELKFIDKSKEKS